MEDPLGGLETVSMTSAFTGSTISMMDPPSRLENEYEPLQDIYSSHSEPLPIRNPGIKESNSDALIQALKALQLKIRQLELERADTEDHFKHISEETLRRQDEMITNDENSPLSIIQSSPVHVDHNFDRRLNSLDTRFALQAKELELLRERLRQAENDREEAMMKTKELEHKQRELQSDTQSPRKLEELERRQEQLRAANRMTSSKVKDLEGKLLRQQWQNRKLMKSSAQPEIIVEVGSEQRKKSAVRKRTEPTPLSKPVPGIHYHLNMKDVPFVVGTSTNPSHSVSANYQKVLSLMKYHNPLLCGAAAANIRVGDKGKKKRMGGAKTKGPPPGATLDELKGFLKALEEEFGCLAFQHEELSRVIQEQQQQDPNAVQHMEELESELGDIIRQLESKMEQIQVIKRLISSAKKKRKEEKCKGLPKSRPLVTPVPRDGEVRIITTVKAKDGKKKYPLRCASSSSSTSSYRSSRVELDDRVCGLGGSQESLTVLKRMKTLQSTLQRDDLSWT